MSVINKIFIKFFVNLIKFYSFFSPFFYKSTCRFTPTCSQYAAQSISKYGPIIGVYKSIIRLIKCNPFGKYGYAPIEGKANKTKWKNKVIYS